MGTGEIPVGTGFSYSLGNDSWADLGVDLPARKFASSGSVKSFWVIWGGRVDNELVQSGLRVQLPSNWLATNPKGAPAPRFLPAAATVAETLWVWGGFEHESEMHSDGAIYDPVVDAWTPMAVPEGIKGRAGSSMAWLPGVGAVVIWGGFDNSGLLNSGWMVNPVSNQWSAMSLTNAPSAREDAALSTVSDSKVFVFGGLVATDSAVSESGDGAIYDASTDTWSPLDLECAPSPRVSASATPIGDNAVLVWGGATIGIENGPIETAYIYRL
jgi:hypothetical protein